MGMPEDCRRSGSGIHLTDWLSALATRSFVEGMHGSYSWRVPAENLSWEAFGDFGDAMKQRCNAMAKMAALLIGTYATPLEEALQEPNALRDRMTPWYRTYFADVKHMQDEERQRLLEGARAWKECLGSWCGWMYRVLDNLPPVLRWADELSRIRAEATEHYETVLTAAGQLAWLIYDAEKSGLAQESYVHRHSMEDSEA